MNQKKFKRISRNFRKASRLVELAVWAITELTKAKGGSNGKAKP